MGNQKRKSPGKKGNLPRKARKTEVRHTGLWNYYEQTGARADDPDVGTTHHGHPEPQQIPSGYMPFSPMPQVYLHNHPYAHPPGPYYGHPEVMLSPPPIPPPPQLQPMPMSMPMPMPMPINYLASNSAQENAHGYNEYPNPQPHMNINGESNNFPQSPLHCNREPSLDPAPSGPQNGTSPSQNGSDNITVPPVDIPGPPGEAEATGLESNVNLGDALPRIPFSIRGDVIKRNRQVDEKIDTLIKASSDAYGHTNDRIAMLDARILFLESRVIDLEAALKERENAA
ncbi:uncharacterized protein E0L32_000774 [Thyridium curvatum]|uniref:Uncharacterized protein n=1 Tax=Thyridium curvatum TaxID=1093900 RepID=A0A507AYJ9_9PEZI|nr:uncharacterized protein E0L32_000774 [Thyridium curvatum]TPX12597.1 hypothetical protein E0L32_000774 [Thyridium curvatum]